MSSLSSYGAVREKKPREGDTILPEHRWCRLSRLWCGVSLGLAFALLNAYLYIGPTVYRLQQDWQATWQASARQELDARFAAQRQDVQQALAACEPRHVEIPEYSTKRWGAK